MQRFGEIIRVTRRKQRLGFLLEKRGLDQINGREVIQRICEKHFEDDEDVHLGEEEMEKNRGEELAF